MNRQVARVTIPSVSTQRITVLKIISFTLLVQILAWSAPFLGGSPTEPGLGLLVWGLAPIGAGLLLRLVTRDWHDTGFRFNFKQNKKWYLLSVVFYPLVIALVLALGVLLGLINMDAFRWSAYLTALLPASVIYLVFSIFEEFGWRGYLAPKMASLNLNKLIGHIIVGIIWASWHLPFIATFASYTDEALISFIPRYFVGLPALAIVYGELGLRTRSVWPAVLLHWLGNMIATPLILLMSFRGNSAAYVSFGSSSLLMMVIAASVGVVLYRQREKAERSSTTNSVNSLQY